MSVNTWTCRHCDHWRYPWLPHGRCGLGHYAGKRIWCTRGRETLAGECWIVIPGQGIHQEGEGVIWDEHAWQVRDGEVEPVLIEIEPRSRQVEVRV